MAGSNDNSYVQWLIGPDFNSFSVGWCGSGGVVNGWLPTFYSSTAGAQLDVYFLDVNGQPLGPADEPGPKHTYTLPTATLVGACALGMTSNSSVGSGTFLYDSPKQAVGGRAFCRVSPIQVGQGGLPNVDPNTQSPNSFPFVGLAVDTPFTMNVGDYLEWCMVAGSHGWKITEASSGGSEIDRTNSTFIEGSEGTTSNAQTFTITSTTPWVALTTGATTLTSRAGVHIVNLGTLDLEVGTTLNLARWVVPAGSDRYIPIATGKTLYAAGVGGSATSIYATEYGF